MLSKKMEELLSEQLNIEFYSAYAYLSMSAYCRSISMNGCAKWLYAQAQEEVVHAMKFYDFISDRHGTLNLLPIKQPKAGFSSLLDVFEQALGHEKHVTAQINEIVGAALSESDHTSHAFLQWFLTEQIEEEATVGDIVESMKLVKDSGQGKLMLDRELGTRTFPSPT